METEILETLKFTNNLLIGLAFWFILFFIYCKLTDIEEAIRKLSEKDEEK